VAPLKLPRVQVLLVLLLLSGLPLLAVLQLHFLARLKQPLRLLVVLHRPVLVLLLLLLLEQVLVLFVVLLAMFLPHNEKPDKLLVQFLELAQAAWALAT
jgi:hypothetical protein